MQERDPKEGPTPSLLNPQQDPPGTEDKLRPEAIMARPATRGAASFRGWPR